MKRFVVLFLLSVCGQVLCNYLQDPDYEHALELHAQYPLIDGHNDLPLEYRNRGYDLFALPIHTNLTGIVHTDIGRLRAGGMGAQFWSVYIGCNFQDRNAVSATLEQIDSVYQMARLYPDVFEIVTTADEVEAAFAAGRIGSLMGVEGGHQIDTSLGTLRMFYELGVRYMTLTHNCNTPWSDAQSGPDEHGGLNDYGREVIREMNRLGMMVDISHTAHTTMHDALDASVAPVIFSHTCCYAFVPIQRNAPDDVLSRLRLNGGVAMITFVGSFLTPTGLATSADVADHIDHVVSLAGIDHVGIGADYDGTNSLPIDMPDVSTYPLLTVELIRRGYSDEDIGKVLGGNIIRVMRDVERVALDLQVVPPSVEYLSYSTDCRISLSGKGAKEPEENTNV